MSRHADDGVSAHSVRDGGPARPAKDAGATVSCVESRLRHVARWGPPHAHFSLVLAGGFATVALAPSRAVAADFEVQADSALQAYEVASPSGDVVLQRRRLMQTVGLGVYNIQGAYRPREPDYRVVVLMRLNADFGINANLPASQAGGETNYVTASGNGVRFVPGLAIAPVDLMYGYVEGRNLAHGWFGFRVGRQYVTDVLGWWSFDGALMHMTTPAYVQAEVYAGLEQRSGLPLSTSRFESQGIWRGSHEGFGIGTGLPSATDYPSYQYAEPAPALGFAIETAGIPYVHARMSYRRVDNTGTSITQQFPDPTGGYRTVDGFRVSQDRIGLAMDANKPNLGGIKGGFMYDLYGQLVGSYYGGVEAYAGKHATLGADFDYFVPTFDADSIWNWFTHNPLTTVTGRVSVTPTRRFNLTASGGARLWSTDGNPATFGTTECVAAGFQKSCVAKAWVDPSVGAVSVASQDPGNRALDTTLDALGNLNARYRFPSAEVSFRGMVEAGAQGSREGADVATEKLLDGGRYTLGARASMYGWHDPLRPDRDATSFAYVLAAGFKPTKIAKFRLEWEHDMNRLVGQRFRVLGLINVLVLK